MGGISGCGPERRRTCSASHVLSAVENIHANLDNFRVSIANIDDPYLNSRLMPGLERIEFNVSDSEFWPMSCGEFTVAKINRVSRQPRLFGGGTPKSGGEPSNNSVAMAAIAAV